jgi:hypothetical protein
MWQVMGVFKEMVRRHHVLFSIFCANDDAQVTLTRTQRVAVLAIAIVTAAAHTGYLPTPMLSCALCGHGAAAT